MGPIAAWENARSPVPRALIGAGPEGVASRSVEGQIGWLQQAAGNAAVAQLLGGSRYRSPGRPTVQRCGDVPSGECPCHTTGDEPVLQRMPALAASLQRAQPVTQGPVAPPAPAAASASGHFSGLPAARLGLGTRREPKLKRMGEGPSCRGACGAGCPSSCERHETYRQTFVEGDTLFVVEYPNPIFCRTHRGCQDHDDCFDKCVQAGETSMVGACHNVCSSEASSRWGIHNTMQWMFGYGPADDWWWFVDAPVVVETRPIATVGQHAAIDRLRMPSLADAIIRRARLEYEMAGPNEEPRRKAIYDSIRANADGLPDSHEVARAIYGKMLAAEAANRRYITINLSRDPADQTWRRFATCEWLTGPLTEIGSAVATLLPEGGREVDTINVVFGRVGQCGGPLRLPLTTPTTLRKVMRRI